jgi:hypothetical protein
VTPGQSQVTAPVVEAQVRNINVALHAPLIQAPKKRGQWVQAEAIDYILRHLCDDSHASDALRCGAAYQLEHFVTMVLHEAFNNRKKMLPKIVKGLKLIDCVWTPDERTLFKEHALSLGDMIPHIGKMLKKSSGNCSRI